MRKYIASASAMKVGTITPVKDFQDMLNVKEIDLTSQAINDMTNVIIRMIEESSADEFYSKSMDCLGGLRAACVEEIEPKEFNSFLYRLRDLTTTTYAMFWDMVVSGGVTLITEKECNDGVSQNEADTFLKKQTTAPVPIINTQTMDDDELLDLIE
eukprot:GHVO01018571.1.p1 GENE.GHVO01018571.1~~GHVO01018571.1.p1  ORF type:complete len:156 (-),score=44.55 GHVO01018571.1:119-586(-)